MILNKHKTYNFLPGPAMLPVPVMLKAKEEFLDYQGTGMSIMEMSHRGKHFGEVIQEAESLLRELMGIPSGYSVLFLPGGATLQFSMVPLNLLSETDTADYSVTGVFAKKAFEEAARFSP
ncbi:MAG: aminotransferase class V-fold PLP-dependent enzyme, partial [Leptospira sp.]|nr:aminotransferase class V-fold PLP-dependent enzyme [Leptospira sp.]